MYIVYAKYSMCKCVSACAFCIVCAMCMYNIRHEDVHNCMYIIYEDNDMSLKVLIIYYYVYVHICFIYRI